MGQDDQDLNASLAHVVLCCVAGSSIKHMSGKSFTHPGMHANFFIHGVVGFLHHQSSTLNSDFTKIYGLSYKASRYLALPCLMADLYSGDQNMSLVHLASGAIPFALALAGSDDPHLGNLMIACNILSLCYYSFKHKREWGWYTAGSGVVAYFLGKQSNIRIFYPLSLALMEYCAKKLFHAHHDSAALP